MRHRSALSGHWLMARDLRTPSSRQDVQLWWLWGATGFLLSALILFLSYSYFPSFSCPGQIINRKQSPLITHIYLPWHLLTRTLPSGKSQIIPLLPHTNLPTFQRDPSQQMGLEHPTCPSRLFRCSCSHSSTVHISCCKSSKNSFGWEQFRLLIWLKCPHEHIDVYVLDCLMATKEPHYSNHPFCPSHAYHSSNTKTKYSPISHEDIHSACIRSLFRGTPNTAASDIHYPMHPACNWCDLWRCIGIRSSALDIYFRGIMTVFFLVLMGATLGLFCSKFDDWSFTKSFRSSHSSSATMQSPAFMIMYFVFLRCQK